MSPHSLFGCLAHRGRESAVRERPNRPEDCRLAPTHSTDADNLARSLINGRNDRFPPHLLRGEHRGLSDRERFHRIKRRVAEFMKLALHA